MRCTRWVLLASLLLAACAESAVPDASTGQPTVQPAPTAIPTIAPGPTAVFPNGLILAWHREGGLAGFCDDVSVYVTGQVYAASCKGGQPRDLGTSRLTADQLKQVLAWGDKLKGFEINQADPATTDKMIIRMVFAGAGTVAATEADKQAIQGFAVKLFADSSK